MHRYLKPTVDWRIRVTFASVIRFILDIMYNCINRIYNKMLCIDKIIIRKKNNVTVKISDIRIMGSCPIQFFRKWGLNYVIYKHALC
jgi:hypothetical protein